MKFDGTRHVQTPWIYGTHTSITWPGLNGKPSTSSFLLELVGFALALQSKDECNHNLNDLTERCPTGTPLK